MLQVTSLSHESKYIGSARDEELSRALGGGFTFTRGPPAVADMLNRQATSGSGDALFSGNQALLWSPRAIADMLSSPVSASSSQALSGPSGNISRGSDVISNDELVMQGAPKALSSCKKPGGGVDYEALRRQLVSFGKCSAKRLGLIICMDYHKCSFSPLLKLPHSSA